MVLALIGSSNRFDENLIVALVKTILDELLGDPIVRLGLADRGIRKQLRYHVLNAIPQPRANSGDSSQAMISRYFDNPLPLASKRKSAGV